MLMRFLFRSVPLTRRAAPAGRLHTVRADGAEHVEHVLQVPLGACPVSGNPLSGTISVAYAPSGTSLEVVSLHRALAWACSGAPGAPRSVEELATWMRQETTSALGVRTTVVLDLVLRPGRQRLVVRA